jgi:hypothetical protein
MSSKKRGRNSCSLNVSRECQALVVDKTLKSQEKIFNYKLKSNINNKYMLTGFVLKNELCVFMISDLFFASMDKQIDKVVFSEKITNNFGRLEVRKGRSL